MKIQKEYLDKGGEYDFGYHGCQLEDPYRLSLRKRYDLYEFYRFYLRSRTQEIVYSSHYLHAVLTVAIGMTGYKATIEK